MKRKIYVRGFLAAVGLLGGIVIAEIFVRILFPATTPFIQPDPRFGWIGTPNASGTFNGADPTVSDVPSHEYKLNSLGMHDVEHSIQKPDELYRILLLGDSFAEAMQVPLEMTSRSVLENCLNSTQSVYNYDVVLGATSGWETDQQALYLEEEGLDSKPDLVLLYFFLFNDVNGNTHLFGRSNDKPYFVLESDGLDLQNYPVSTPTTDYPEAALAEDVALADRLDRVLEYYSLLYVAIRSRYWQLTSKHLRTRLLSDPSSPEFFSLYGDFSELPDESQYAWELTEAILERMQAASNDAGAEFAVVILPPRSLVNRSLWKQLGADYPEVRKDSWDNNLGIQLADAMLARLGVPHFSLLQPLRQRAEEGEALYYEHDPHWNVVGNRVAGESVCTWVSEVLLSKDISVDR